MTQKLGLARTVGLLEGPVEPQESLFLLSISGRSSHTVKHLYPVFLASGPDTAWGVTLAAPVKNDQCAQGDEHQTSQPQADKVALRVVQGA